MQHRAEPWGRSLGPFFPASLCLKSGPFPGVPANKLRIRERRSKSLVRQPGSIVTDCVNRVSGLALFRFVLFPTNPL